MPWSAQQFASRHNHGLSPHQAAFAAHMANGMLRTGVPEGETIATANKVAERHAGGGMIGHYDAGGGIQADPATTGLGGIGGAAPSAMTMNPITQGMIQRYASLPPEKLQELATMLGSQSPQGQIIRMVLQRKQMQPQAQAPVAAAQPQLAVPGAPQAPVAPPVAAPVAARRGGDVPERAYGGSVLGVPMSMAAPWWARREAYGGGAGGVRGGFLAGSTAGRADAVQTQAPGGSYVLPADVIAGLGDGNSLAGARVMDETLRTGPGGIPLPRMARGRGAPSPPRVSPQMMGAARGGAQGGGAMTPVMLSHGEYVVSPEQVAAIGGGDRRRGHRILDSFVVETRKRYADKLKRLPGPVKAGARS